jgi:CRISPR-associated endonuclease/helicase Cas3
MSYLVGANSLVGRDDSLFSLLSTNKPSLEAYKRKYNDNPDLTFAQSFQSASKLFEVIDTATRGVIVPYGAEGKRLIAELCGELELREQLKLLKQAQRYSVNLFVHEFKRLAEIGAISETQAGSGVYYLDERYYSKEFGWSDEAVSDMEFLSA